MPETVFCGECGSQISAGAKFCKSCGVKQESFVVNAKRPEESSKAPQEATGDEHSATPSQESLSPGEQPTDTALDPAPDNSSSEPRPEETKAGASAGVAEHIEKIGPGASELAGQLAARLQTPGVATAGVAALTGAAALFVAGLLFAIIFSDESIIGAVGTDTGVLTDAFRQMSQFLLVGFGEGSERSGPAALALVPIAACGLGAVMQAPRTRILDPRSRLLWGAATGVPFALLMLVPAIAAGEADPSIAGSILLGFLWGALGGTLGTLYAIHRDAPEAIGTILPPQILPALATARATFRPLILAFLIGALLATSVYMIQTIRDRHEIRVGRSLPIALVENALFAVDYGVHFNELGAIVAFRTQAGLPLPVGNSSEIMGFGNPKDEFEDSESIDTFPETFTLFDYRKGLAAYFFIPLVIVTIGIIALMALYAGFAVARSRRANTLERGAAWGALVGPLWSIAAVIANAVVLKTFFGMASGESVFVMFLIGGAAIGALGGLLAAQSVRQTEDVAKKVSNA